MNMMPHPTTNHAEPLEGRVEEPPLSFLIPATPFFLFFFPYPGFILGALEGALSDRKTIAQERRQKGGGDTTIPST